MQGRWVQPLEESGGRLLALQRLTDVHLQLGSPPCALRASRGLCPFPAPARALLDLDSESDLPGCVGGGGDCGGCRVVQAGWEAGDARGLCSTFLNKLSNRRGCCCCTFYVKLKVSHARVKPAF